MADAPKVSVVIPTYKRPHLIGRAVGSVLAQTYGDFEVIVVNDGPPDGTREVVDALGDPRICYLEHPKNRGISATRNTGIAAARAQRVAFLDSDDEWLPEKLKKQVAVFDTAGPDVGVVYTERLSTADNVHFAVPAPPVNKRDGWIHDSLLLGSMITCQTAMVDARCFAACGVFDESLHHLEDWDLWLRISKRFSFTFMGEPLVKVYAEQGSASTDRTNLIAALEAILRKHSADFEEAGGRVLAAQHYLLGRLLHSSGARTRGLTYLWRAIRENPRQPKYYAALLVAAFGIAR